MLKIQGTVKGVKTEHQQGRDGKPDWEKHFVGFEVPKANGFDGEMIVEKVQISREQYQAGIMAKYEAVRGQIVEADVFINTFATRNGAGYQLFLSGDGKPRAIK